MVNFLVLFLATKNGEITIDECAVLLKMELKRKFFFKSHILIFKRTALLMKFLREKKKKKNQYQFQSNIDILKLGNISQKCILYKNN